jgi:Tfp pilus assembly protein PilX
MFSLQTNVRSQAGFALLYAVIVIAVLSSLGSVLSNLLVRESRLSATSRQSSRAYYSADASQECALYWDLQEEHFPDPNEESNPSDPDDIFCSDQGSIPVSASSSSGVNEYTFSFSNSSVNVCTGDITVVKEDKGDRMVTEIESLGRESCGSNFQVERALRTTY